ncbi:uncharacterized protein MELLADRAFT_95148 [Melampsora larici-populina 98AG31]|uniref:CCHC-type domain-containing protein n=1 Tax=Melampsora larici-populina (strain 98AG31 / pathotype 3-4-7) TaxID=747676 RepID=F4RCA2_MELLP|nr:uncharacterized protein MELLADRAFT_95148 [Melampsora larici-populina 98AG31]EGG09987.1 hypothetical protein MELLADRAFT_95148 [Melampsora larici-populina 98AG31]
MSRGHEYKHPLTQAASIVHLHPIVSTAKNSAYKTRHVTTQMSERSPSPIPHKALPQVKAGLPECFYCGLFGHWFKACPDRLAFLSKTGVPREHWQLLKNGKFYNITAIRPSILEAKLGSSQPLLTQLTSAASIDDEIEAHLEASKEAFHKAFEAFVPDVTSEGMTAESFSQYEAEVFAAYKAAAAQAANKHLASIQNPKDGVVGEEDGLD